MRSSDTHHSWLKLDDQTLGTLDISGIDNFWIYGHFEPAPDFQQYQQLFEQLEAAWTQDDSDEALDLQEQVNALNLVMVGTAGDVQHIRDFKLSNKAFEFKFALD